MFFDKLKRWVSNETSNRSGLLSSPVALVVDTSRKVAIPPIMKLEQWLKLRATTPTKAVAFLQIYRDYTNVMIVDVEHHTLAMRIELDTKALGQFTAVFLTDEKAELRSILQAPPWLVKVAKRTAAAQPSAGLSAEGSGQMMALMAFPPDAETNGVRPIGEKPPEPPKVQALITLGGETAALQNLPVVSSSPIEN